MDKNIQKSRLYWFSIARASSTARYHSTPSIVKFIKFPAPWYRERRWSMLVKIFFCDFMDATE